MSCATGTIKYTLFLFNTLWAILGILVIIFGGLGWGAMPQEYAIGIIILGGTILLISIFGCLGAIRESTRMLWTYVSLLLVLLVLIILSIVFNSRDVFKRYALQKVETFWQHEITHPGSMDAIQKTYACCGLNSFKDYIDIGRSYPSTCCKDTNCINPLNLYAIGCVPKVEHEFADEYVITKYYEYGFLGFDLIILSLAVILAIHYTNRQRRYNY